MALLLLDEPIRQRRGTERQAHGGLDRHEYLHGQVGGARQTRRAREHDRAKAAELGNMVAVADVNLVHAEAFADDYEGRCEVYQDYRKLLERKDIDVVTIGTPDHWHVKIAIDAMQAGKDVYCEKPLTLTIDEGKQICKVVEANGQGLPGRHAAAERVRQQVPDGRRLARSGRLGKKLHAPSVRSARPTTGGPFRPAAPPKELDWDIWLGQAPEVPYTRSAATGTFRWWLEYSGGKLTDWGVHHVDIALWALGGDEHRPGRDRGQGRLPRLRPTRLRSGRVPRRQGEAAQRLQRGHEFDCT